MNIAKKSNTLYNISRFERPATYNPAGQNMARIMPPVQKNHPEIINILKTAKFLALGFLEFLFWLGWPLRIASCLALRPLWPLIFRFQILGRENLDKIRQGGVLFIANHHSRSDPFSIGSCLPWPLYWRIGQVRYMTYWKQMFLRPYGPFLWFYGSYPIFSANGNYEKSLAGTIRRLREGKNIIMFPTAYMDRDFDPQNARPGVAFLARALNPLIVPVRLSNLRAQNFSGRPWRKKELKVAFGQPFHWLEAGAASDSLPDLAKKIMAKVGEIRI